MRKNKTILSKQIHFLHYLCLPIPENNIVLLFTKIIWKGSLQSKDIL